LVSIPKNKKYKFANFNLLHHFKLKNMIRAKKIRLSRAAVAAAIRINLCHTYSQPIKSKRAGIAVWANLMQAIFRI
jgi:hypothetical protein